MESQSDDLAAELYAAIAASAEGISSISEAVVTVGGSGRQSLGDRLTTRPALLSLAPLDRFFVLHLMLIIHEQV